MEILVSNNLSKKFYEKWVRDTKRSLYLAAPIFFIFSLICFTLIVGVSVKLLLIMILPTVWIFFALINRPLLIRRKYLNTLIESALIENENITISTYKWFSAKPIIVNLRIADINFQKIEGLDFFKGKTVYNASISSLSGQNLYLVVEFFENRTSVYGMLNIPL